MTSVNTNAAALTALRTLQNTNSQLESVQSRISTGFKIGEAKDNAAYWAISTTLKSDNKSLATVKDALGLGASTVDTAYQGLNKAKDVLDEIKSKLTAATQDGVNRDTIQQEIGQLQQQLKSIASSSVFSGENWLSVDSSAISYSANKSVVASFSRDASGSVSIGTIGVDTTNVALFDASTATGAGGILNGKVNLVSNGRDLAFGGASTATGNTTLGGLKVLSDTGVSAVAITDTGEVGTNATATLGTGYTTITGITALNGAQPTDGVKVTVTTDLGNNVDIDVTYADLLAADGVSAGGNNDNNVSAAEFVKAFNTVAAGVPTAGVEAFIEGTAVKLRRTDAGELKTFTAATVAALNAGGMTGRTAGLTNGSSFTTGSGEAKITSTNLNLSGLAATDKVKMTFRIDGVDKVVTVVGASNTADKTEFAADLDAKLGSDGTAKIVNGELVMTGKGVGTGKSIQLVEVSYLTTGNVVKEPTVATGLPYNEMASAKTDAFGGSFALTDADDKIQFDVKVNGATTSTLVTVDKALIDKTLNRNTGVISTAAEYATVLTAALTNAKVTGLTVKDDAGQIVFATTQRGATASVDVANVTATNGAKQISVDKIDISANGLSTVGVTTSDQIKTVLKAYIEVVNGAINKITSAAASLGSVASRIDMQKSFVNTLMDTIDKGVGNLIDADMSEESTKLQALQVKQQLGVQSLSIANQSAQSVLSLFRG